VNEKEKEREIMHRSSKPAGK